MTRVRPRIARNPRPGRRVLFLAPLEDRCVPAGNPWTQRGGDGGHTGYADVAVNAGAITPAWSQAISYASSGYWDQNGNRGVAVDGTRVYRTELEGYWADGNYHVMAYDLATGAPLWNRVIVGNGPVSAPSVGSGYVYVNRSGHSGISGGGPEELPYLAALDPQTGAVVRSVNYAAQWNSDERPVLAGNQVIDYDGYYGGISSWDATSLARQWNRAGWQSVGQAAAVDAQYVYAYANVVFDRASGATVRTVTGPTGYPWVADPIVSPSGRVLYEVRNDQYYSNQWALSAYTAGAAAPVWTTPMPNAVGGAAVGNGVVAVTSGGKLHILDEATGAVRQTWTAPNPFGSYLSPQVVLTRTHAFVQVDGYLYGPSTVYAVNLATGQSEWSYANAQGDENSYTRMEVAIGGGRLILSQDGFVKAFDIEGTTAPPTAADDAATTAEDTAVTVAVLANDTDPDGGTLTVTAVGTPAHGTAVLNADGTVTYTPAANYNGSDGFTYTIGDGQGGTDTATVSVTVTPVNDPPVATGGSGSTAEDTPLSGDLTGTDPDGGTLTYVVVDGPAHGALTSFDPATGAFTYTPAADYNGADSFTFQVTDGSASSDPATFAITVTAANDPPTVDPIPDATIPEDSGEQTVTVTGLSAGEAGQTLTVTATSSDPAIIPHPAVTYAGGDTATLTYTPAADAFGEVTITVSVSDGADTTVETFVVTVGAVPDRPVVDTSFTPMLPPIKMPIPKGTSPAGAPIATLAAHVTDADPGDLRGVAVTGADTANGRWEYTTDGGATWRPLPAVSPAAALLLAEDGQTQLRFIPNKRAPRVKSFTRGFAGLTYKAWDGSNGAAADTTGDTTVAADTAYSTNTEWAWVAVGKTTPAVDAAGHPLLKAIREDRRQSPAYAVKSFLGLLARETDPARTFGVAVSGATGTGTWEFNTGKGGWLPLGVVGDAQALLLRPTDRVRFKPGKDFDGEARLTYHTWDLAAGLPGERVDVTAGAGFGAATEAAILDILPVNDAPVLDTTPNVSLGTTQLFGPPLTTTVAALLGGAATDVETPAAGIGILVLGGTGGTWEYSADGVTWTTVTRPVYLAPTARIRFQPTTFGVPTATLRYRAWDGAALKPSAASRAVETATVTLTEP